MTDKLDDIISSNCFGTWIARDIVVARNMLKVIWSIFCASYLCSDFLPAKRNVVHQTCTDIVFPFTNNKTKKRSKHNLSVIVCKSNTTTKDNFLLIMHTCYFRCFISEKSVIFLSNPPKFACRLKKQKSYYTTFAGKVDRSKNTQVI
jgi:hypothetical protein